MKKLNFASIASKSFIILGFLALAVFFNGCKKADIIPAPPSTPPAGSGEGMFWIGSNLGCGNITVTIGGISKLITSYTTTIPNCTYSGAATFALTPGTYSYTASCTGLSWNGTITITDGGCTKIQLTGSGGGGGGGGSTGQGMFWTASDLGCGNITVVCNSITRTITGYFPSGAPACGSSGAVTFDLSPGTYSYTASCSGKNWSGTITITAGGCNRIQLTSSGGGGTTTGQGIFWTRTNFGCGIINVTLNGVTRTVSSYYSSVPACGASGCANYTLNPGIYSYTASCSGYTWSGTITIILGGCSHVEFI